MEPKPQRVYRFGAFLLDVSDRTLRQDGKPIGLSPKTFDVLVVLVESNGRLVDKETLMSRVWHGSFVEENTINRSISVLRKALGEKNYIATVPKHGYRFAAEVIEPDCDDSVLVIERHTAAEIVTEVETTNLSEVTHALRIQAEPVPATSPMRLPTGLRR